ncbi:MAG TPA: helix-turn-helix transcriptional regulator [Acidimicrobiales bacterium]
MLVASYELAPGQRFPWHEHPAHQLSLASGGVLSMGVGQHVWVLPRSRALWIPAHVRHSVDALGGVTMTTLWFDPATCPVRWAAPTVLAVDPLLAHLAARLDGEDLDPAARRRSEAVLFDLLEPIPTDLLDLPMPTDDRARAVAERLRADPADDRTLGEWGREVGASDRTLMRAFTAGTGLTFHQWRTRARILAALPRLAEGVAVAAVAPTVGYATASAFGAAFRRVLGTTPSAYLGTTDADP